MAICVPGVLAIYQALCWPERQGADKKRFTLKALLYGRHAHFIHLVKAQERRERTQAKRGKKP